MSNFHQMGMRARERLAVASSFSFSSFGGLGGGCHSVMRCCAPFLIPPFPPLVPNPLWKKKRKGSGTKKREERDEEAFSFFLLLPISRLNGCHLSPKQRKGGNKKQPPIIFTRESSGSLGGEKEFGPSKWPARSVEHLPLKKKERKMLKR